MSLTVEHKRRTAGVRDLCNFGDVSPNRSPNSEQDQTLQPQKTQTGLPVAGLNKVKNISL